MKLNILTCRCLSWGEDFFDNIAKLFNVRRKIENFPCKRVCESWLSLPFLSEVSFDNVSCSITTSNVELLKCSCFSRLSSEDIRSCSESEHLLEKREVTLTLILLILF